MDVLISWRDDVDDDTNVMRDVLREVIIISDNEDDEVDLPVADAMSRRDHEVREKSIEIISASNHLHTQRLDLAAEPSELGNEPPVQYIPRTFPSSSERPYDRSREERQGAQRHQRWQEAVSRQRDGASSSNPYPRPVQLISEPIYDASRPNDVGHQSRILQKPVSASIPQMYENKRTMQYDDSQRHFPQPQIEYRAVNPVKDSLSSSQIPIRQVSIHMMKLNNKD